MSLSDEDVAARGRSIFERLRAEQHVEADVPGEAGGQSRSESEGVRPEAALPGQAFSWQELSELAPRTGHELERPLDAPPLTGAGSAGSPSEQDAPTPNGMDSPHASSPPSSPGDTPEPEPRDGSDHADGTSGPVGSAKLGGYQPKPPTMPELPGERTTSPLPPEEHPAPPTPAVAQKRPVIAPRASDHFARPLPRILAIANQKGGVGKTTTTVNLGASLAVLGYRTLVVDLDPQGNATTGLGINSRNLEHSIYDVILHDVAMDDCVEPTSLRNLYVAPATIDLAGAEIELVPAFSREMRLKRALEDVRDDYDMVLIDCPPSLGLLTVNGLAAATEVIVPIQCEYYALEGLGQLLRNVNLVQSNLNPKLEVSAIVLTMYDARTKLAEQVADEVRTHFGTKVCRNVIPRTVRLSEAPSFGQPIIVFDPSSRGALAYRELAKEVSGGTPQRVG